MEKGDLMKTVLITGGSRGIGKAIAKKICKENYNLIINYRENEIMANELRDELLIKGFNIIAVKADISKIDEVEKLFKIAEENFNGVDILINNAGMSQVSLFQDLSPEDFKKIFDINLFGIYNTIHFALPYMLKKKDGVIINISSVWGSNGASCEVAYSATKGAVESLTKSLAVELAPSNIRVNAIAPGVVDTDMMKSYSDEDINLIKNEIPMMRFAKPEEVANLVSYIISEDNKYMTGQIIGINGGMCV